MRITIDFEAPIVGALALHCAQVAFNRALINNSELSDTVIEGLRITNEGYNDNIAVTVKQTDEVTHFALASVKYL